MYKVISVFVFLFFGILSGVYFFRPNETELRNSHHVIARENNSDFNNNSSNPIVSEKSIPQTKDLNFNQKAEDIFKEVQSQEIKSALKRSFKHPLTHGKDNSNEYENSIQQLNLDPTAALLEISKVIINLGTKDDGIRTHLLNLAMQTNAQVEDKGEFLKIYLTKGQFKTNPSGLSDDSFSAVIAIDYMAQTFKTEKEAQAVISEILLIEDLNLRTEFKNRILVHYPEVI